MCRAVEHLTGRLKAANEGSGKSGQGDNWEEWMPA
jgi:hypothetical protein